MDEMHRIHNQLANVPQAGGDIILAVALAIEMRNRTGYSKKTDSVLNRVAVYGVATGAVTATLVSVQLLLYVAWNLYEDLIFFGMPYGGVYIATFLANLHTRSSLKRIAAQTMNVVFRRDAPTQSSLPTIHD
ncbi:hypothetical protein DL93DRAFT_1760412 [Clavulina sp. PMI_390]|nr:hypothetical protein DL93DRAFT_1760412 [Clavulina sp. PMI_390]